MASAGAQRNDNVGNGYRAWLDRIVREGTVASNTLLVCDITGLLDAGHNLSHEARLLAMAREIGQLRAAVCTKGRGETVEL